MEPRLGWSKMAERRQNKKNGKKITTIKVPRKIYMRNNGSRNRWWAWHDAKTNTERKREVDVWFKGFMCFFYLSISFFLMDILFFRFDWTIFTNNIKKYENSFIPIHKNEALKQYNTKIKQKQPKLTLSSEFYFWKFQVKKKLLLALRSRTIDGFGFFVLLEIRSEMCALQRTLQNQGSKHILSRNILIQEMTSFWTGIWNYVFPKQNMTLNLSKPYWI